MKSPTPSSLKVHITPSALIKAQKATIDLNYTVIRMVLHGFSSEGIARHTGLTYSQVQYRVRMFALQGVRSLFRMGGTEEARKVIKMALDVPETKKKKDCAIYEKVRRNVLSVLAGTESESAATYFRKKPLNDE